jgi:hypothetical protein
VNLVFQAVRRYGHEWSGLDVGYILRAAGDDVQRAVDVIEQLAGQGNELTPELIVNRLSRDGMRSATKERDSLHAANFFGRAS